MNRVKKIAAHRFFLVIASVSTIIAGLVMRSCHLGEGSLLVPVCGGEPVILALGNSPAMHCAGCYVAVAGCLTSAVSVFGLAKNHAKS